MKKTYGKPVISFESFAFSNNVAGACGNVNGIHGEGACDVYGTFSDPVNGSCQFIDNGFSIFYSGCMMAPQEDDPNNLCYHVNTADNRIFAS